jgi:hypothetical protein
LLCSSSPLPVAAAISSSLVCRCVKLPSTIFPDSQIRLQLWIPNDSELDDLMHCVCHHIPDLESASRTLVGLGWNIFH